jgi:glutaredoxin-like YruB-family protein
MVDVKIYSTESCIWCKKAKAFFKENKVKYTNIDVGNNQENVKKMVEISGQTGTPVIVVDKKVMVGFDEDKLKKLLKL